MWTKIIESDSHYSDVDKVVDVTLIIKLIAEQDFYNSVTDYIMIGVKSCLYYKVRYRDRRFIWRLKDKIVKKVYSHSVIMAAIRVLKMHGWEIMPNYCGDGIRVNKVPFDGETVVEKSHAMLMRLNQLDVEIDA